LSVPIKRGWWRIFSKSWQHFFHFQIRRALYNGLRGSRLTGGVPTSEIDTMETAVMARPKGRPKKVGGLNPRPTALTVKGNLEWRDWVERVAEHCRTDIAKLVDAAIVEYAEKRGFAEKPPRR
jgi:hypothetical protein